MTEQHQDDDLYSVRIELPTRFKNELIAEAAARQVAEIAGFDDDAIEEIETALGEACLNAIEHSQVRERRIAVTLTPGTGCLQVTVEDQGVGFEAEEVDSQPEIGEKLKSAYKRGWGVMLMEQLMDEIVISNLEPHGTRVAMKKYKSSATQTEE